jgi:acetylornithine/succinyldiaminopimelate/putrescine aminotransferase
MQPRHPVLDTCEQILREQTPNLLRLYLNPYVAQTCFCLTRYVQTTWGAAAGLSHRHPAQVGEYQTFLANGFDEALSGAIKLARCFVFKLASIIGPVEDRDRTVLVLDAANRLSPFAGIRHACGEPIEFVPGLTVLGPGDEFPSVDWNNPPFGAVVLIPATDGRLCHADKVRPLIETGFPLVITCVQRDTLSAIRRDSSLLIAEISPDIVIFDETFVNRDVPFSAFTARKEIYDLWNRPGKTTFHSTTFQPNTIASMHFVRCLRKEDPAFQATLARDLKRIGTSSNMRRDCFRRLYSPSLCRTIRAAGFDTADVRARGDFILVDDRRVFDAVSGVACSVRGHNPAGYVEELQTQGSLPEVEAELSQRLRKLTGLERVLPAVSGATAVENALKIALTAQYPRRHVLALKAGFGGKTLLALTGTANPVYKENIAPLYPHVLYVDPFAENAEAQIDAVLREHPVAVVQLELIQAVGGVRRVPERVVRLLDARRKEAGYLLLVDEIQTGMYRTGQFTLSGAMGISPDLLLLGKGTSDMMFPFALLLHSAAIGERLAWAGSELPAAIRARYGYEFGYRTVLNVLRRAEEMSLPHRVAEAGELFTRLLGAGLASCPAVREVRVFGLLIGIELNAARWPQRWFRKRLYSFYLLAMLRHAGYPVLAGFCQYEPNVLKITPALTVGPEETRAVCATITDVLKRPFHRLLAGVAGGLLRSIRIGRKKNEHVDDPAHEPAAL